MSRPEVIVLLQTPIFVYMSLKMVLRNALPLDRLKLNSCSQHGGGRSLESVQLLDEAAAICLFSSRLLQISRATMKRAALMVWF